MWRENWRRYWKKRFLWHSILCMSDTNVAPKRAATMLNDGINTYFSSVFFLFLWLQFWNLIVTLCKLRTASFSYMLALLWAQFFRLRCKYTYILLADGTPLKSTLSTVFQSPLTFGRLCGLNCWIVSFCSDSRIGYQLFLPESIPAIGVDGIQASLALY